MSHRHRSGDVGDIQRPFRFAGNESWAYGYDKNQSPIILMGAFRRAKTEKGTSTSVKCEGFVHCFLPFGVVHYEFLPQGRAVNEEYYFKLCGDYANQLSQKHTKLWKNQPWILHNVTHQLTHCCLYVSF